MSSRITRGNRINISNFRHAFNRKYRVRTSEFDMKFNKEVFESINMNAFSNGNDQHIFDTYHKCFVELLNYIKNVLATNSRDYVGLKFNLP